MKCHLYPKYLDVFNSDTITSYHLLLKFESLDLFNLYYSLGKSTDDKLVIFFLFFPENRI